MPSLEKAPVVFHRRLSENIYLLEYFSPAMAREARPGQFVNVRVGESNDPFLRRPISIHDVNMETECVSLLYKVVGRGTEMMSRLGLNDSIDIMGPLGNGFSLPDKAGRVLLVGGGMGIAPLTFLARALKSRALETTVLYGAESLEKAVALNFFRDHGIECRLATFDGSGGHKGLVTALLDEIGSAHRLFQKLYCCGPAAMMNLVAEWAHLNSMEAEFSLEEHMACGVGACLGCACKLKSDDENYVKVCKDGPVFNLNRLGEMEGNR